MTLTFPRDLPAAFPVRGVAFEPRHTLVSAATRGGLVQVAEVGRALWAVRYETAPMRRDEAHALTAWLHSLRGGARLFKAWHPLKRYPLSYPNGWGGLVIAGGATPFTGVCDLNAVGATLDTVDLVNLPASFAFADGDLLSFAYGSAGQALHRVVEAATSNASGAVTLGVEPAIVPGWAVGADVSLEKPWCKAVLEADSVSVAWQLGQRATISFSAVQVL